MAYLNFKEFERNKQYWKILVTSQSKKKQNIISNDDLNTSYMFNTEYTVVWYYLEKIPQNSFQDRQDFEKGQAFHEQTAEKLPAFWTPHPA